MPQSQGNQILKLCHFYSVVQKPGGEHVDTAFICHGVTS